MKKIFLFILLLIIPLLFISYVYIYPNNNYSQKFKNLFPDDSRKYISKLLKNTIFIIPELNRKINEVRIDLLFTKEKIKYLEKVNKNNLYNVSKTGETFIGEFYSREIYSKNNLKLGLKKYNLPIYENATKKARAYIGLNRDKIIIVRGDGALFYIDKDKLEKNNTILNLLKSNIKEIIFDEAFYDNNNITKYGGFVGVKGILINENKIYISYLKELNDDCYNISIIYSELNFEYLNFSDFFSKDECVQTDSYESDYGNGFSLLHSGGKMIYFDYKKNNEKGILFTTGELQNRPLAQDPDSIFGKILLLNLDGSMSSIFASGFRNPHGLTFSKKNNIIISTDHGPVGGDEVNIIYQGENYGWPISSYGGHYPRGNNKIPLKEIIKESPLHNSHKEFGFQEPIYVFDESVAPSQIIKVSDKFSTQTIDNFILTSLKAKSLFFLKFDNQFSKVISLEKILINERIRDIIYDEVYNQFYLIFENTFSLGILSNSSKAFQNCYDNLTSIETTYRVDQLNLHYRQKNRISNFCKENIR